MMKSTILRDGYARATVMDSAEAKSVKDACAGRLEAEGHVVHTDGLTLTLRPPYEEAPIQWLIRLAHRLLTAVGFEDVVFWSARLINKVPGEGVRSFHQDWWAWKEAVAYADEPPQIGVMVYLQETGLENGALRVIPGAHRDVGRIKGLYTDPASQCVQADEVTVDANPQEFIVIDARLPHATHPNTSGEDRAMITLWFIPNYGNLPRHLQEYVYRTKEYTEVGLSPILDGPLATDYEANIDINDMQVPLAEGV